MPKTVIVFSAVDGKPGFFDMKVNGRAAEYDIEPDEFMAAIRRRRLVPTEVWTEDSTGYRQRLTR